MAVAADGFILLRPATVARKPAVDVYRSANGTTWTFEATLGTPAGFVAGMVNGGAGQGGAGQGGAVVTGQAGPALIAFVSADGASWRRTPAFGTAAAQDVSGVATAPGGTVVTAGTTTSDPDSRLPLLTVLGAQGAPENVDINKIPGADDPQLAVNDVAAGNGMQVAVGSANGYPAAWTSANGGSTWTRANGQTPARVRPAGGPAADQRDPRRRRLAGRGRRHRRHRPASGGPRLRERQRLDRRRRRGRLQPARPGHRAGGGGPHDRLRHRRLSVRRGPHDRRRLVVGRPGRLAARGGQHPGHGSGRAGRAGASRQMLAVTAGPRGFVAVGSAGSAPAAWSSADGGQAWTQQNVPLPVGATRAVLQHVASDGHTVVAVGAALTTTGQQLPFAASSADGGTTWTESALPVPAGRASVTALTATGTRAATATGAGAEFLATGTFGSTPGHQDVVVWTSAGGSAWTAATPAGKGLTGTGIQAITGLDVSDSTLTGVGFTATPGGEQPVFWQSPVR